MKKLYFLALVAITLVSCKQESKQTETVDETTTLKKENFYVELETTSSKKDDFALYFTTDNTNDFNGTQAVWHGVDSLTEELVTFDIPEEFLPTNLRLDLGLNKAQDSVVVKKVKLSYLDKNLEFTGDNFFTYFIKDDQFKTKVDSIKKTLTIYKDGAEYKTPYFYPTQELTDKITTIVK